MLSLVMEHDIQRAVVVQIELANRLGIENPAIQANLFGSVLESAVAPVAEVAIRAAEAADDDIKLAITGDVTKSAASRHADGPGQVARLCSDVSEASLAVI